MIAIGFSSSRASLERLPGWDSESWAYHGDDGKAFVGEGQGQGRPFGPTFALNDTVGCGVNFSTGSAFFTKNGILIGIFFCLFLPKAMTNSHRYGVQGPSGHEKYSLVSIHRYEET